MPNLITPFIDNRHVDIINKNGHFPPSRRTICSPHPLIYIAFHSPLRENRSDTEKQITTTHTAFDEDTKIEGWAKALDRSVNFHPDTIYSTSLINVQLNHVQETAVPISVCT